MKIAITAAKALERSVLYVLPGSRRQRFLIFHLTGIITRNHHKKPAAAVWMQNALPASPVLGIAAHG